MPLKILAKDRLAPDRVNVVPGGKQRLDRVRADEAGGAGQQNTASTLAHLAALATRIADHGVRITASRQPPGPRQRLLGAPLS
jgi:hypothetical protein